MYRYALFIRFTFFNGDDRKAVLPIYFQGIYNNKESKFSIKSAPFYPSFHSTCCYMCNIEHGKAPWETVAALPTCKFADSPAWNIEFNWISLCSKYLCVCVLDIQYIIYFCADPFSYFKNLDWLLGLNVSKSVALRSVCACLKGQGHDFRIG